METAAGGGGGGVLQCSTKEEGRTLLYYVQGQRRGATNKLTLLLAFQRLSLLQQKPEARNEKACNIVMTDLPTHPLIPTVLGVRITKRQLDRCIPRCSNWNRRISDTNTTTTILECYSKCLKHDGSVPWFFYGPQRPLHAVRGGILVPSVVGDGAGLRSLRHGACGWVGTSLLWPTLCIRMCTHLSTFAMTTA